MSERGWEFRIADILDCIKAIEEFTFGMTYDGFEGNRLVFDAVVRNIEIIGEASKHIPDEIFARYPEIKWKQVKGMRDIIVHEYMGISRKVVWAVVRDELPPLKATVMKMRDQEI